MTVDELGHRGWPFFEHAAEPTTVPIRPAFGCDFKPPGELAER
ncbi:hypothetical protein [Nocardia sp. NBC_00403]